MSGEGALDSPGDLSPGDQESKQHVQHPDSGNGEQVPKKLSLIQRGLYDPDDESISFIGSR